MRARRRQIFFGGHGWSPNLAPAAPKEPMRGASGDALITAEGLLHLQTIHTCDNILIYPLMIVDF
jgi:hypothetical protein